MTTLEPPCHAAVEALRHADLFSGLDPAALHDLARHVEQVAMAGGEVVLRQGEPADALYIVRTGRLRATITTAEGERLLGEVGAGEVIGERGLLAGRPRGATVSTIRDSMLLRISSEAFLATLEAHPQTVRSLAATLVDRSTAGDERAWRRGVVGNIAVVPAGTPAPTGAELEGFVEQLLRSLERHGPVRRLDEATVRAEAGDGDAEVLAWLDRVERQHRFTVYVADDEATDWTARCVRQADRALLVATSSSNPAPNPAEAVALSGRTPVRRDLVLLHQPGTTPSATARWLARRRLDAHHHVRRGDVADHARIARALAGRTVSVALAGGGPRGLAHLGVLRALEESGVPIDAIGGTSVGAILGATVAMGLDDAERRRLAIRSFVETRWLLGPTLPLVSMSSATKLTRLLRAESALGERAIEDLWLPFTCVSANLTRAEPVLHREGPVWWAVRASSALPGILPPVWHQGDLLVDGGVIDNLPLDVLRARFDGPLVAVDLAVKVEHEATPPFPSTLSGWRVLARRLNPFVASYALPNPIEMLLRAKDISVRQMERGVLSSCHADLYFNPPTAGYPALDFSCGEELIEVGYRHASEQLAREGVPFTF